jgi:Flp pilus assembly protein TadD
VYLKKALQQRPDLGQAYRDLGRASMQTGDFEQAVIYLKKVIELSPDEPSSHYLLAQAYQKLGKNSERMAELASFEKLKKAEQERMKPPGILAAGPADETSEGGPEEPSTDAP